MEIFGESLNAVKNMISNAQAVLEKTKQLNANENTQIQHPDNFNPYNPNSNKQFAKEMFARANAQAEILNLAQQVANNFHSIQGPIQGDLQECKSGTGVAANNTYGIGCAFVKEASIHTYLDYYGNQVNHTKDLSNTILNFKETFSA